MPEATTARSAASQRLSGKRAIVTGGARGIGLAISRRLTEEGASVAIIDQDPAVEDVAADLQCLSVIADLGDAEAARDAIHTAGSKLGGLWLLVNNAGVFAKTPLLEITVSEWDKVMEVNARSMLVTIQAAVPFLLDGGGGRIVNQASMAAKLGTPGEAHYAASKAAVLALTRIAAMELGPHAITVNALCPGYVLTNMGAHTRDEEQIAAWTAQSPLGRLASPDDVAGAVAFLASEDAAYLTGEALNVSGGMCTW